MRSDRSEGRRDSHARRYRPAVLLSLLAAGILLQPVRPSSAPATQADRLSDAEFWEFFTTKSEAGGSFVSENFVSNETSFQDVIPTLQHRLTPGGVYLGVGPEQNFTYIANLKPQLAVIFDIRRQNAMQHLMYKALFELSPTRVEFLQRLFARPFGALPDTTDISVLIDSAFAARPSDSAWVATRKAMADLLTKQHGFALSPDDLASIAYVYRVFFEAGPAVNYSFRPGTGAALRAIYPSFGLLQEARNADSVRMGFLATEDNYRAVRDMQIRNLIVPVVGDFAGPSAIRSVGDYLWARGLTVTAFYLSNVEQYLFRTSGAPDRFYGNVAALPTDTASMFIRSVPRTGYSGVSTSAGSIAFRGNAGYSARLAYSISVQDSAGLRLMRVVLDSNGVPVSRVWVDTVRGTQGSPDTARWRVDTTFSTALQSMIRVRDSLAKQSPDPSAGGPRLRVMSSGTLTSGLAPIRATLDAHFDGRLPTYQSVVGMTQVDGWRQPH